MSITDSAVYNNEAKNGGFLYGNLSDLILVNSYFGNNMAQDLTVKDLVGLTGVALINLENFITL